MANLDLSKYGIVGDFEVVHNPSYETLFQDETNPANEGFERAKLTKQVQQPFTPVNSPDVLPKTNTLLKTM